MNQIQKKISDAVYRASEGSIIYEDAYDMIVEALKNQKIEFETKGLIPTMELLIEELEAHD